MDPCLLETTKSVLLQNVTFQNPTLLLFAVTSFT
jgi:hypothetical protein